MTLIMVSEFASTKSTLSGAGVSEGVIWRFNGTGASNGLSFRENSGIIPDVLEPPSPVNEGCFAVSAKSVSLLFVLRRSELLSSVDCESIREFV